MAKVWAQVLCAQQRGRKLWVSFPFQSYPKGSMAPSLPTSVVPEAQRTEQGPCMGLQSHS